MSTSDSTHPTLYLESKLRASSAVHGLFDEVRAAAKRENKVPLLCLFQKGRQGCLLVMSSTDLDAILDARAEARAAAAAVEAQAEPGLN